MKKCCREFKTRVIDVAVLSDSTSVRFVLMMAELIWAITLLWPGETFERPVYAAMAALFNENIWGMALLATAFGQLALIIYGRYNNVPSLIFAAWNVLLWWFIVIGMYDSVGPLISGEVALAIAASWILCKTGTNRKERHDRRTL